MGTEIRLFLMPRVNSFRPEPSALSSFVQALRDESWICDPQQTWFRKLTFSWMAQHAHASTSGAYVSSAGRVGEAYAAFPTSNLSDFFAERAESDVVVVWPVENDGHQSFPLRYPVESPSKLPDAPYYNVELWLSHDYLYRTSEIIDPFDDERCSCGAELEYQPSGKLGGLLSCSRLSARCRTCGKAFAAQDRVASARDPWTGKSTSIRGGTTFRFALAIDCGSCWQGGETVHADLLELCERHFGQRFYQALENG